MKLFKNLFIISAVCILLGSCAQAHFVAARKAEYPINPIFIQRQSKTDLHRAMNSEELRGKLMSCFEAARWAPSAGNSQPLRFIYSVYGAADWDRMLGLLSRGNHAWAQKAGALIAVVSQSRSFEAGLAVENFLLQATELGLAIHPVGGFDHERAQKDLNIPNDYRVEVMIAVGEAAAPEHSQRKFADRDSKLSQRKSLSEIVFEGTLPAAE